MDMTKTSLSIHGDLHGYIHIHSKPAYLLSISGFVKYCEETWLVGQFSPILWSVFD